MHEQRVRSIHGLLVLTAWADGHIVAPEIAMEQIILDEVPELAALEDRRGLADAAKRSCHQDCLAFPGFQTFFHQQSTRQHHHRQTRRHLGSHPFWNGG